MKLTPPDNRPDGLTMIELLVVLACLCLLIALLLPRVCKNLQKTPMTACVNNLKQVMLGQIASADDYNSRGLAENLPVDAAGARKSLTHGGIASYFQALSNLLGSPKTLTCPSDSRKPADDFRSLTTNHLSYFLNLDAMSGIDASTAFNGDRHITFAPVPHGPIVILTTNLSMQWAKKLGHRDRGNVALVDGSVQKTSNRDLAATLLPRSNTVPQRLLFP